MICPEGEAVILALQAMLGEMLVATVNQPAMWALLSLPQVLLCAQEAGIGGLLRGLCGKRGWKSRHDCSVSSHLDDKLVFPLPTAGKSVEISLIGSQTSDGEYFAEKNASDARNARLSTTEGGK